MDYTKLVEKIIWIWDGFYTVFFRGEKYSLHIQTLEHDRIVKFYAENLSRKDIISGNFYKIGANYRFRPCEIPSEHAYDFILHMSDITS